MSTCVCVLSNSGERLMPTIRLGKVRRLLKDGKVNVEFKAPAKNGQKSASLKKLKIVKAADSIHPAWEKVS